MPDSALPSCAKRRASGFDEDLQPRLLCNVLAMRRNACSMTFVSSKVTVTGLTLFSAGQFRPARFLRLLKPDARNEARTSNSIAHFGHKPDTHIGRAIVVLHKLL